MWYLLWFVGILLMCSLSTLALVWLESRQQLRGKPGPAPSDSGYFYLYTRLAKTFPRRQDDITLIHVVIITFTFRGAS